jgi:hypothetical protein
MKNALTFAAVAEAATGLALSTSSMGFSRSPFRFTSCTSTKTPRLAARGAFLWADVSYRRFGLWACRAPDPNWRCQH